MRRFCAILFMLFRLTISVFLESAPTLAGERLTGVAFAQAAGIRAVNFHQGDAKCLSRARRDFTPAAWRDFMKYMDGYVDAKGAPLFDSSFVPSHDAEVLGTDNGVVHIRIPDTLIQSSGSSRTTYRAAIEMYAGGRPPRITHLEQITCGAAPCR
jgi:hypothetical protein